MLSSRTDLLSCHALGAWPPPLLVGAAPHSCLPFCTQEARPGSQRSRPAPEWLGPAPAASFPTPPPRVPSPRVLPPQALRTVSAYTPYIVRAGSSRGLPAGTWGRGSGERAPDSPRRPRLKAGLGGGSSLTWGKPCQISTAAHLGVKRIWNLNEGFPTLPVLGEGGCRCLYKCGLPASSPAKIPAYPYPGCSMSARACLARVQS